MFQTCWSRTTWGGKLELTPLKKRVWVCALLCSGVFEYMRVFRCVCVGVGVCSSEWGERKLRKQFYFRNEFLMKVCFWILEPPSLELFGKFYYFIIFFNFSSRSGTEIGKVHPTWLINHCSRLIFNLIMAVQRESQAKNNFLFSTKKLSF